jgi:PAS domain S-box-containing protein
MIPGFFSHKMIIKKIVFLFVVLSIPIKILAADNSLTIANFTTADNKLDLQPYIQILSDPDQGLSINDIVKGEAKNNFKPISAVGNSFGFSKAAYWIRFTTHFDEMLNDTVLLQLEYPQIDNVRLYIPDGLGGFSERVTGDRLPFSSREVNHRTLLFQLPEHRGESRTYYMRLYTEGSMQISLSLWAARTFIEHVDSTNLVLGGYFGVMLLLSLVALIAYFKVGDRLFLYYAVYVSSFLLFLLSLYGFSYQYLWPEFPLFGSRVSSVLMGLSIIFGLFFCGSFFQIWQGKHPRIRLLFNVLIICGFIGSVMSLFGHYATAVQFSTFIGLVTPPVVLIAAVSSLAKGYKPARYFLVAFSIFLLGVFIATLLEFGFVPRTFITVYAMQIGSLFNIILLAYALMDRIDQLRDQKEAALEKASAYLYQLNNGLDAQVIERTKQLSESESQLRTLVQTLPDLVWWKDPDGVYKACNPKFERFFGAAQAEIIGKTDYDFLDKKLADFFREKDNVAIAAGKASLNEEEVTYADDGHKELLETIKMPMYSSDGKLMGVLGVARDITERKRSEQALLDAQKMEAIGQLTGGIAHDFNNILAIIIGNLGMLKRQLLADDEASKRIGVIQKSAQRAADLTRQLLSFSRNQAEQQTVTDINQVLNDMDSLIVHSITPAIEVKYEFADDLWFSEIDPGEFQDAVINLIINARDAMSGSGQLILQTSNCTLDEKVCALYPELEAGDYVQLAVIDNGEGISSAKQAHIFEPFYTTKEQGKGTGMGLAMVFGFIKRANGCVTVESEVGVGTVFRLYLPKSGGQIQTKEVVETDVINEQHRGRETILVVDDEEALLELAREILEELDYRVLTAVNAKQALQVLANEPDIALLLSDVLMPGGINGYELAETAMDNYPGLKVLLASGYTSKSEIHKSQARFSANMLTKPYHLSELAKRIRQLLDG